MSRTPASSATSAASGATASVYATPPVTDWLVTAAVLAVPEKLPLLPVADSVKADTSAPLTTLPDGSSTCLTSVSCAGEGCLLVNVQDIVTLADVEDSVTAWHRFRAVMVTAFAVLALALAMVGVFGALSYAVQLQMRDFGVRRALGATNGDVLRLVLRQALRVIVSGAAIGFIAAALLSQYIASLLFGVQPMDPATFALVCAALTVTAALSLAGPAWRATHVEPVRVLR